jgi:hypothetical protein
MVYPFPSVMGAAVGAGAIVEKYRLNITSKETSGNWASIAELEFRAAVGGADLCNGGIPADSAHNSGEDARFAFDNDTSTRWSTGTATVPQQIEYDFRTVFDAKQIALTPDSSAFGDTPNAFTVQRWNGASWQAHWTEDAFRVTNGAQLIFSKPDAGVAGATRWRLKITATQGTSGNWVSISEVELRGTAGGADLTAADSSDGGSSFSNSTASDLSEKAFDNSNSTLTQSGFAPSGGSPYYLGYRFPTQVDLHEVTIRNTSTTDDSPKTFDVQMQDPATGSWSTIWSVADAGTWSASQTKTFTRP